jgi:predicted extracellular nuclease
MEMLMSRFAHRLTNACLTVTMLSAVALVGCASTTASGGGTDTTQTVQDTAQGSDTGSGGNDTSPGADSAAVTTVTIGQIREANKTCGSAGTDPQNFGDQKNVLVTDLIVASPNKKANDAGTLYGVFAQTAGGGQFSGLYVVGQTDTIKALKVGNKIAVTGDVKDFYCQTQIFAKKVEVLSATTDLPAATTVTLAEIGDKATREQNELYEGVLVQLDNVVMGGEALSTQGKTVGNYFVGADENDNALRIGDDFAGVYLTDKVGDTYPLKYPKGTKFGRLQGVFEYAFGQYRLTLSKDPTGIVKP